MASSRVPSPCPLPRERGFGTAKLLLCTVGGAALCSAAHGQIAKTKAGYLLRAHYVKGMVIKYDSTTSVKGGGTTIPPFHVGITIEVTKVVRGIGTVKITQGAVKMNGTVVMPSSSLEMSLDNRNTTGKQGSQAVGPPLPIKPINPGATWNSVMPVTFMGQVKPLRAVYRFVGMTNVNGKPVGVIVFSMTGLAEGAGKMYIRASDGTMESSEMKLSLGAGATGGSSASMAQVQIDLKRK